MRTSLGADAVVARVRALSKRGKLPGFEAGGHGGLFSCAAHGSVMDKRLIALADPAGAGAGTRLRWSLRLDRRIPVTLGVLLVVSVWPGLPITDSLLRTWFDWYARIFAPDRSVKTWMWYLPLTVLPAPWVWIALKRKTDVLTAAAAREAIEKIARAVESAPPDVGPSQEPAPKPAPKPDQKPDRGDGPPTGG